MEDLELWKNMKQGDRSAFEMIYRNHIQALYKYGARLSQDANLIEDCIHDLFLDLWNKRKSIGETDSIAPYLITALRRKVYKKSKKAQKTQLKESIEAFDQESIFNWPEDESGTTSKNQDKIQSLIQNLTARQKEIIYLKYIRGLDYEEIGQILDMKYQSVRNLVHRALLKMRKGVSIYFIIFWSSVEYKVSTLGLMN